MPTEFLLALLFAAGQPAAGTPPPSHEPEVLEEYCPLYTVFFDEGSAEVTAQAASIIDNWATFARLMEIPRNRFTIEGVAMDETRSPSEDLELSFERGRAIVDYLTQRGLAADRFRIRAVGQSSEAWNDPNHSADLNRAQNRRATLILETTASNVRRVSGDAIC